MTIIDRLARNARKQKVYRHIVRGRDTQVSYETAKRKADAYFLHKYAGLSYTAIGRILGISHGRVRQIATKGEARLKFTVCHPKKSCM